MSRIAHQAEMICELAHSPSLDQHTHPALRDTVVLLRYHAATLTEFAKHLQFDEIIESLLTEDGSYNFDAEW